jgi:hypothetical protein
MKKSPEAGSFNGPGNTTMTEEHAEMLANMQNADPTIGAAELPESPVSGEDLASSMEEMLAAMGPEARENMESILADIGGVPVANLVELSPEAVAGTDQLEALANDPAEHAKVEQAGSSVESAGDATSEVVDETTAAEQPATSSEPDQEALPALKSPQEAEDIRRKIAAEEVDAILQGSKGVNAIERVKLARAEKQWRADVRAVNKPALKQEIRDAKLKLDIAKDTYGRRGQRVLRRVERKAWNKDIDKRRAEGKLSYMQAKFGKLASYGSARAKVTEMSKDKISNAETAVDTARENRRTFLDQNGRRNNTLRKNYGRVKARTAEGNYQSSGYASGERQSLSTMYNSEAYVEKRKAERKRKEDLEKARRDAAKQRSAKRK